VAGRRGAAAGACLLASLCGAIPASAGRPPAARAIAGERAADADELSRLRHAHRARPDDPQAALELGLFLFERDGASLEAQGLLDAASRRFPHRHDVHLKLLESYLLRKNASAVTALLARLQGELESSEEFAFDAACLLLRQGAKPDDPQRALELGLLVFQRDKASLEAQGLLDAASRRFPHRHDVHLSLLESYLLQENAPAVTALLARVQGELDSSERFAFDVIYCLLQHRQYPLAQAQWQRIDARAQKDAPPGSPLALAPDTTLAPGAAEAQFVQGLLAAVAGRKEEALRLFHRADTRGFPPHDSPLLFMVADSFYWLKEYGLAAGTYGAAVQRFPGNVPARLRLGASLYWTSQLPQARKELERVLRESPRQLEANYYLGRVLFALKRADEARVSFERELALDPGCGRCMSMMAHLAYMAGDDREAESWLEKAVARGAASPETDLVHGMIANRAGKYDVAIRHLSRAVEQAPQSAQAQFQLATAYQRSGDAEKALEHFALYRRLAAQENAPPADGAR
jgi:tetratricopeptide (TPR) repeat protein